MYKLLPILLFAFLFAEENSEPLFIQPDSLDFVWAEGMIDELVDKFIADISNIIDKDKLIITIEKKIIDVIISDTFSEIVKQALEELEMDEDIHIFIHKPNSIDSHPPSYISYTFSVEVNIDKTIELNSKLEATIYSILESNHFKIKKGAIIFNSVDINQFQSKKNNTISLHRDDIYDDSWAVIIGIDKYKYSDQLNYAVKDAEAVKDMLINKFDFPEDNIKYLVNEEATLSEIKLALNDIASSADEDDRILVFYSGHGETQKNNDGTETGYIIPVEGRQDKPYATGIAMDDILHVRCLMQNICYF